MENLSIHKGLNQKLPNWIYTFNLPSGKTCPKATKECKKFCYAMKYQRLYPTVLNCRLRNFKETKKKDFVSNFQKQLNQKRIKKAFNFKGYQRVLRFLESGDIYNQQFLDSIKKIASKNSNTLFYFYTKSYHLDFKKMPKNLIGFDSDNKNKQLKNKAIVINDKKELPNGYFLCPASCKICNYCYNPKIKTVKKVAFVKH